MPVTVSNDAFAPYRGKDDIIAQYPIVNGNVYFAYDTKKMYFDANGERHALGGDGIHFVYGSANPDEVAVDQATNYYVFPRIKIDAKHYLLDDIIINKDGTFYRIKELTDDMAYCEKLLVSGSGGGGDGSGITFNAITPFPASYPYGTNIEGKFIVFDAYGGTSAIIYISYYDNAQAAEPRLTESLTVKVGEEFPITLKSSNLKAGDNNYIVMYAIVDGEESRKRTYAINCVDLVFAPTEGWDPKAPFDKGQTINFPYMITSQSGSIPDDLNVTVYCDIDGIANIERTIKQDRGEIDLSALFTSLDQGGHNLSIRAETTISGVVVTIGDLYYGIAYNTGDTEKIMIWSPYNETEVENYTIIEIPFMVLDPSRDDGKADVQLIVNGEVVNERTVTYNATAYEIWEISDYKVEENNTFIIQCKDTQKVFTVYIKKNHAINLDAISDGCGLYLTTLGRSNSEYASKRKTWPNRATVSVPSFGLGTIELNNFNWFNNGWIKTISDGVALRVTNGASVRIPLTTMTSTTPEPRAYEFDFCVRNPVNFSKLVDSKMEVQVDGSEKLVKSVSDGEGAFLKYYDSDAKKGLMLGTQDAFFAINATDIVNVKYAAEERIKVSIVVDAKGQFTPTWADEKGNLTGSSVPMVYMYLNGILSGIQNFSETTDFLAQGATAIEINSDYCDVDIFNIRVYNVPLNYSSITQNWVGDASTLAMRQERYARNQALVKDNKLDYELVKNSGLIPTMVIKTYKNTEVQEADDKLPYQKGNKKVVGIRYYDPDYPEKSFHCQNVELDVQGTSSQGYPRRNYKLKTKEKIEDWSVVPYKMEYWDGIEANKDFWYQDHKGETIGGVEITQELIDSKKTKKIDIGNGTKENTFCLKADYMESSSTHNTCLANLIQFLSPDSGSDRVYNFAHPLRKNFNQKVSYRTTIYGFPCLVFHENAAGDIVFVGKYNFNLDKGATDAFGFTIKETNPHTAVKIHDSWKEIDGEDVLVTEDTPRQSTFAEVAECWEFTQNQTGLGKFQCSDESKGFFEITTTGDNKDRLEAYTHFENRYHYLDFDMEDIYKDEGNAIGNQKLTQYSEHFAKMWAWVHSTDTTTVPASPNALETPKFYTTLSTEYDPNITYYLPDSEEEAQITATLSFDYEPEEEESNMNFPSIDQEAFKQAVIVYLGLTGDAEVTNAMLAGSYSFAKNSETGIFEISKYDEDGNETSYTAADFGITIPESNDRDLFNVTGTVTYDGFSTLLREKFTLDDIRYRKAKFKNEFTEHFDLEYVLMYFIITELLLLYDSRQKNMMIASWGPTSHTEDEEGNIIPGNYIWYPIFYDMDTQLGVNNSGQVYWDYDEDATPTELDDKGNLKNSSIFSGNGSVLWNNVILCFSEQIKNAYRELRKNGLTVENLNQYYNIAGSDRWTEIMKNIDEDYKYIQPAVSGFTNQEGKWAQTTDFFYCLQGDRKLNRESFFEYRLNYIDSQWLGGAYDPTSQSGAAIQMRFNANDPVWTSDDNKTEAFEAEASYDITPFLSQYVSAIYDETATTPKRFDINGTEKSVKVVPPDSIQNRLNDGYTLSQQLVYVRGPQYISDLGDLSLKYLNEFWSSAAVRLRRLKIGNSTPGYKNLGLTSQGFKLASEKGNVAAKQLLNYLDITNLSELNQELDIGGCIKLATLKALGTNLPKIVLPEGNVLKSVYLPKTLSEIRLVSPLELEGVLTSAPQGEDEPEGLYIEGLTDKLSSSIDSTTTQNIGLVQLDDTKLGLGSYRIIDYLYRVKNAAQQSVVSGSTKFLRISATNVEWSPYIMIEPNLEYGEDIMALGQLYELVNGVTYEEYTYNANNWATKTLNGLIFYKDADFDTTAITQLGMVKRFVDDKEDGTVTIEGNNYYFSALDTDPTNPKNKVLPILSGRMHINNANGTAIEEGELFNRYGAYYPDLEITVDKLIESYRTHFVEYLEDGTIKTLGRQKVTIEGATTGSTVVKYPGEKPSRLHYDFVGWLDNRTVLTGEDGSIETLQDRASIITEEEQETFTSNGKLVTTDNLSTAFDMASTDPDNSDLTLVAVYVIHGYDMTFIGTFRGVNGGADRDKIVLKIPAGTPIIPPEEIPYKDDTDPATYKLTECNKFIGWHISNDNTEAVTDLSKILASTEMTFYAKFTIDSVYNNPLTLDQLDYVLRTDIGDFSQSGLTSTGLVINPKASLGLTGKICFPSELTITTAEGDKTYPVLSIAGPSISGGTSNGLAYNTGLYAVFFKGCEEGAKTPSQVRTFQTNCFRECYKLYYIDIPDSLQAIENQAFRGCTKLVIDDLKNVNTIYGNAFMYAASEQPEAELLIIPGDLGYYEFAMNNAGWRQVQIGSQAHPLNRESFTLYCEKKIVGNMSTDDPVYIESVVFVYDPSQLTEDEIEAKLSSLIGAYNAHQEAADGNLVTYQTATV